MYSFVGRKKLISFFNSTENKWKQFWSLMNFRRSVQHWAYTNRSRLSKWWIARVSLTAEWRCLSERVKFNITKSHWTQQMNNNKWNKAIQLLLWSHAEITFFNSYLNLRLQPKSIKDKRNLKSFTLPFKKFYITGSRRRTQFFI